VSFDFKVIVPRPEDLYYAEVTTEAGETVRWPIDALNERAALHEVGWILAASSWHPGRPATAALFRVDGTRVATGGPTSFEEAGSNPFKAAEGAPVPTDDEWAHAEGRWAR
jgi:hypothetical protein